MKNDFVVIDVETTGLDINQDRIVTLAAVKHTGDGELIEFEIKVNPGRPISKDATAVHGITNEMAKAWPLFKDSAEALYQFCDGCHLVGHNIKRFDMPLIDTEMQRAGFKTWRSWEHEIIDTLEIFRAYLPHTLDGAVRYYVDRGFEGRDDHDAMEDVKLTSQVFMGQIVAHGLPDNMFDIAVKICELVGVTADLAGYLGHTEDGKNLLFNFGKHKGRLISLEKGYCNWMLGGSFPPDTKALIRKELGL